MMQGQGAIKEFLIASKKALSQLALYEMVRVVLGNETCDLDSAVCTLAQGYNDYTEIQELKEYTVAVIPVLNIPQKHFHLKNEVIYLLEYLNIPLDSLTFRDQIDLKSLMGEDEQDKRLELVLVDHHTLPEKDIVLKSAISGIYDHRPLNVFCDWPADILHMEAVGSCATIVANNILKYNTEIMDAQLANLLRSAILVDTCNLSKRGGVVKNMDIDVVASLEHFCCSIPDRTVFFKEIMIAKVDISKLTLEEILHKDLKIARGVPIVVIYSVLIQDFLMREDDVIGAIEKFSIGKNSNVVVLLGIEKRDSCINKDIAIFTRLSDKLGDKITKELVSSEAPPLKLSFIDELQKETYSLCLYNITETKITRKQVLPIVEKAVLHHQLETNNISKKE